MNISDRTFRTVVVAAIAGFALVVVHDVWARNYFERCLKTSVQIDDHFNSQRVREGRMAGERPTTAELEKEYRATHRPKTWLF